MNILLRNCQNAMSWLIPRSVFVPYWFAWLCLSLISILKWGVRKKDRQDSDPLLCIEAGMKGWEIIEYKELYASACEYLGSQNVYKLQIRQKGSYCAQVRHAIIKNRPTHFLYSPRTGSQNRAVGLYQSFRIATLLHWHGVIPIAALTDLPFRQWRAQCAVVTAKKGIVAAQMSPKKVHRIFPHGRLVGPCLMPFSMQTMATLNALRQQTQNTPSPSAVFTGSLYEPRITILNRINDLLKDKGHAIEIKGHQLGEKRTDDTDYWQAIIDAPVIVTTADQIIEKGRDWNFMPHFLFRYTEVLACGCLLVAPSIPGVERFFTPGEHFAGYTSPEHAAEQISFFLENKKEQDKIARQGAMRIQSLVSARTYWMTIDTALGKNAFL